MSSKKFSTISEYLNYKTNCPFCGSFLVPSVEKYFKESDDVLTFLGWNAREKILSFHFRPDYFKNGEMPYHCDIYDDGSVKFLSFNNVILSDCFNKNSFYLLQSCKNKKCAAENSYCIFSFSLEIINNKIKNIEIFRESVLKDNLGVTLQNDYSLKESFIHFHNSNFNTVSLEFYEFDRYSLEDLDSKIKTILAFE